MIKIYSAPQMYSNLEALESLQDGVVDMYLSENKITNPDIKAKIMQLIKVKNERRLLNGINGVNINIEDESYVLDENGNLYLKRLNDLFKLAPSGVFISYIVDNGILRIYTETGTYNCDLKNVDFKALVNNLASQQVMLEREINTLMGRTSMNRPYINSDTVSTVVARDTGVIAEVMEPIQSRPQLKRPHIKRETMSMLQGKIKTFELDTKKKKLLAQKEMMQQMMANQQAMINTAIEDEEEPDKGMSM